jgi:hypothetical protein
MIDQEPRSRAKLDEIPRCPWFQDPFIQTIKHLEQLLGKELSQQQSFLIGLAKIITKFDKKVLKDKVIPGLFGLLKIEQLSPILVALLFRMLESKLLSNSEFTSLVWPELKSLMQGKEIPAQALYLLVYRMPTIHELISKEDFSLVMIPTYLKVLECGVVKLQELALKMIPDFITKQLDYQTFKSNILPRLFRLISAEANTSVEIRKSTLVCFKLILHILDKSTIQDQLLPALEKVRKLNNNSRINALILSLFEGSCKSLSMEVRTHYFVDGSRSWEHAYLDRWFLIWSIKI